ncbi:hypothetical protein NUW54_g7557 [Trametes sanguinea]|uniref:Uncharacterized protein n=1 Tax=Trametes sanguinea TaxID=158606 RepID=A0ACC1PK60_9APHY|nr:hypothetical protein NUW54_g7557 [Trametes sanguinea]
MRPPPVHDKLGNDVWIKDHFLGNGTRPGQNKSHWNRWCKECVQAQVATTIEDETRRFTAGELNVIHTAEMIQAETELVLAVLDNPTTSNPRPVISKLESLIAHLTKCPNVAGQVREHAKLLKECRSAKSRPTDKENSTTHSLASAVVLTPLSSIFPEHSSGSGAGHLLVATSPQGIAARGSHNLSRSDTILLPHAGTSSSPSQPTLSDHYSSVSMGKHPRVDLGSDGLSPDLQAEFQTDVCKLLLSGNCAFRLTELPYWHHFFKKWVPGAELPTRHAVSGRILDAEAERVLEGMKMHLAGRYATGQSDGWKSISKTSIIASMVNAEYEPYILHSHDVSDEAKTAENLLKIVEVEIAFCEDTLNITLAAWCTDGGGDCAKMRRLLLLGGYANFWFKLLTHVAQIRLTVGDYLKAKTPMVAVIDITLEVIKWFNNHTGQHPPGGRRTTSPSTGCSLWRGDAPTWDTAAPVDMNANYAEEMREAAAADMDALMARLGDGEDVEGQANMDLAFQEME